MGKRHAMYMKMVGGIIQPDVLPFKCEVLNEKPFPLPNWIS